MNPVDEMRDLIEKLNYYTKLYDEGKSPISDKEWDDMYFHLEKLEEETGISLGNSPTIHVDYQVVNQLKKVKHNHPMLSLDKTKSEDEVVEFLAGHDGIAMAKMDGLTCSLCYEDGLLISAETRGNGEIGEDILQNIVRVKGVPIEIPFKDKLVVDGEVICTYEDFEDFSSTYKNPRNFASGSIRLLDSRASAQRRLTFVAWDCITGLDEYKNLSQKIIHLDSLGFIIVPFLVLPINNSDKINHAISLIKGMAKDFSYPIDGIVFKYNNCEYYQSLGATEHHFRGGLAFKFYDEEYETNLKDIEWSMGKTGILTPVAIYDDVDTDDSIINRASLHNLNIMNQLLGKPYKGQKIWVCKQNEIIPQVVRSERSDAALTYIDIPAKCPVCGSNTYVKDDFLYCSNPNCDGKFINQLVHFCGKKGLDIKGLSEATLQKLVDWGWINNYQELFSLSNFRDEWIKKPGFGQKSVDKLLSTIEEVRYCELWQFISALSIPLIGSTYAKEIAKKCKDWFSFREYIEKNYDFTDWDRFGYEMNDSLHRFNYSQADDLAYKILDIHNSLWIDPQGTTPTIKFSEVNGKTFVITGAVHQFQNRDEVKTVIETHGGKVTASVSKNTDYLINNDINSTSSKNIKAKQLSIPIITEEQLIAML